MRHSKRVFETSRRPWTVPGHDGRYLTRAEAVLAAVEAGVDEVEYQAPGTRDRQGVRFYPGDVAAARTVITTLRGPTLRVRVSPVMAGAYEARHARCLPEKLAVPGWHVITAGEARTLLADAAECGADMASGTADAYRNFAAQIRGILAQLGHPVSADVLNA